LLSLLDMMLLLLMNWDSGDDSKNIFQKERKFA
jgi:hypothetical protein